MRLGLAGVALAALAGCGAEPNEGSTTPRDVALSVASAAPPRDGGSAGCAGCHAAIAAEWEMSQHRAAWDDPVFLAAYAIEPDPFCRGCHAPEAKLDDPLDPARHQGIACVTCHEDARDAGAHVRAEAARRPRLAPAKRCEACHQFEFPEPQDAPMQGTAEEHAASPARDKGCESCHMTRAGDHQDHRFRVQGDPAILQRALAVEAAPGAQRSVRVTLRAKDVGHAVPTGDMFRRLEVHARAGCDAGPGPCDEAEPVVLARAFALERGAHGTRRRQIADRRVPASGAPIEAEPLFLQPVAGKKIAWEVVYRRMGPSEAALFGVDLAAEGVVVARGTLDVPR